jgi:RNA polymerase sigma-70 factor (ECF subfamily)
LNTNDTATFDLPSARFHVDVMLDLSPIADDQLVARIARGDAAALEVLYDRYVRQCFGLAMRMLGDSALSEEVVQEVFLKVWTNPGSYSSQKGKFASWLLSLVHHRCIDELRRRSRTEVALEDDETGGVLSTEADPGLEPGDQVWVMEQQRAVRDALTKIPQNQRQVLELAYYRGLSHSEIAARLGQPLGTVKTRIRLGMQSLRQLLEPHGLLAE